MTELVSCPRCGDALDVPVELLGKSVRCAACRTVFTPTPNDAVPTAPRSAGPRPGPRGLPVEGRPAARKSNTWVWVVLLGLVVVFGGMVAACAGWVRHMLNPPMTVHTSDKGQFNIALPGDPTPLTRIDDKTEVVGFVATRPENQETFQVLSRALPANLRNFDPKRADDVLDQLARKELPALAAGTEVQRTTSLGHGKHPAMDVLFEQGNGVFKRVTVVRILVAEGRVYVLSVQGGGEHLLHFWYVRYFFTSFEPLPK